MSVPENAPASGPVGAPLERRAASAASARRLLRVTGRDLGEPFVAFARARAARLALDLDASETGGGTVTLRVAGPAHLIDMLEMAALLGPLDAYVDGIETVDDMTADTMADTMDEADATP